MTNPRSLSAWLALPWLVCAPLYGAPGVPDLARLAWSPSDHWARQGRAIPRLPPPVREHGPGAGTVAQGGVFGWA